ncbi:MAG: D-allose-binding periplasmic protein precursor [Spirochaetes bacterium ADurb.Bin269]|jgi:ribose transport system substrate-binding protein|nr:MAG: D-allose-binding periplasmic protein precursor [Spirochaetes bacterium ADurb.Bin269]
MKKVLCAAVCFALVCGTMAFAGGKKDAAADGKIKITLITMDSIDEHWLKVKAGAEAKAAELGNVELTFNAPPGKVDANVQLQMVEDAITKRANVIMLAPLNKDALSPGVDKATAAGIKVIMVDSGVSTSNYEAFFATNNGNAARLAADTLAKLLDGKGKIAIINAQAGAGTTMTRENEFKDQMKTKYPNIEIVGVQYSDGDKTKAMNQALDFMTANPDLAGFYGCNEGSTVGLAQAVAQSGKSEKIKVVGFDFSNDTKALIQQKAIQATMVQNPYQMGYLGVDAGVRAVKGEAFGGKTIDTGVTVATLENLASIK